MDAAAVRPTPKERDASRRADSISHGLVQRTRADRCAGPSARWAAPSRPMPTTRRWRGASRQTPAWTWCGLPSRRSRLFEPLTDSFAHGSRLAIATSASTPARSEPDGHRHPDACYCVPVEDRSARRTLALRRYQAIGRGRESVVYYKSAPLLPTLRMEICEADAPYSCRRPIGKPRSGQNCGSRRRVCSTLQGMPAAGSRPIRRKFATGCERSPPTNFLDRPPMAAAASITMTRAPRCRDTTGPKILVMPFG